MKPNKLLRLMKDVVTSASLARGNDAHVVGVWRGDVMRLQEAVKNHSHDEVMLALDQLGVEGLVDEPS